MADVQPIQDTNPDLTPTCMISVNRIAHLPVVESTVQTATNIYEKIKEYNSVTQWTCSTAEGAVNKVVEVGMPLATPVIQGLEGPIKKVDGVLCSGLDYVESKVPAVKLPPSEIITTTREFVGKNVTPRVESAYNFVEPTVKNAYEKIEPTVKSAYEKIEPAVQTAKTMVEPTVEKCKQMVEPLVQPAMDKVHELRDSAVHKIEEYMGHCSHNHTDGLTECEECQQVPARNAKNESSEQKQ